MLVLLNISGEYHGIIKGIIILTVIAIEISLKDGLSIFQKQKTNMRI
jgi:ribose/xylose/arabinose/galactoside ABC-type transport system permease subunit